jgi:hypothetical protein
LVSLLLAGDRVEVPQRPKLNKQFVKRTTLVELSDEEVQATPPAGGYRDQYTRNKMFIAPPWQVSTSAFLGSVTFNIVRFYIGTEL